MEQDDLTITTSHTDLITCNCLDAFNALSADILGEDEEFIFYLETAEIPTQGSSKQEFLTWL